MACACWQGKPVLLRQPPSKLQSSFDSWDCLKSLTSNGSLSYPKHCTARWFDYVVNEAILLGFLSVEVVVSVEIMLNLRNRFQKLLLCMICNNCMLHVESARSLTRSTDLPVACASILLTYPLMRRSSRASFCMSEACPLAEPDG